MISLSVGYHRVGDGEVGIRVSRLMIQAHDSNGSGFFVLGVRVSGSRFRASGCGFGIWGLG